MCITGFWKGLSVGPLYRGDIGTKPSAFCTECWHWNGNRHWLTTAYSLSIFGYSRVVLSKSANLRICFYSLRKLRAILSNSSADSNLLHLLSLIWIHIGILDVLYDSDLKQAETTDAVLLGTALFLVEFSLQDMPLIVRFLFHSLIFSAWKSYSNTSRYFRIESQIYSYRCSSGRGSAVSWIIFV